MCVSQMYFQPLCLACPDDVASTGSIVGGMRKGAWFAFTVESLNASEIVDPAPEITKDDSEDDVDMKRLAVSASLSIGPSGVLKCFTDH